MKVRKLRQRSVARRDSVKDFLAESANLPMLASVPDLMQLLAEQCLAAEDVHAAIDRIFLESRWGTSERTLFCVALARAFAARKDLLTAQSFLGQAEQQWDAKAAALDVRRLLALESLGLGHAQPCIDMILEHGLRTSAWLNEAQRNAVRAAVRKQAERIAQMQAHGHELLIAWLRRYPLSTEGRKAVLVEVGSTRELVSSQGSTAKLATFCAGAGIHFITVDMDPHNTAMATEFFARMKMPFEAINRKGEDYLEQFDAPIDAVFLDAYDFDHGKHSALRQSRYQRYLGGSIDEQQCHRMHLSCAESLVHRLVPGGIVCVDDTWLEDGHWTAKGTLAVPYLLAHGFELLEARNRAALLRRPAAERLA